MSNYLVGRSRRSRRAVRLSTGQSVSEQQTFFMTSAATSTMHGGVAWKFIYSRTEERNSRLALESMMVHLQLFDYRACVHAKFLFAKFYCA